MQDAIVFFKLHNHNFLAILEGELVFSLKFVKLPSL